MASADCRKRREENKERRLDEIPGKGGRTRATVAGTKRVSAKRKKGLFDRVF